MIRMKIALQSAELQFDKKQLKKTMRQAGNEVAAAARALIRRSQGGGRTYYRDGTRYEASAPGQAPGSVSGALLRGIKVRPFKSGEGVAIRDSVFYSLFLERGAKGGGRKGGRGARNRRGKAQTTRVLMPRPFLSAALGQRSTSLQERLREAVQQGIAFRKVKP